MRTLRIKGSELMSKKKRHICQIEEGMELKKHVRWFFLILLTPLLPVSLQVCTCFSQPPPPLPHLPPLPDPLSLPPSLPSSSNYQEEYEQNRTLHSFQVLKRDPPGNYPARDESSNAAHPPPLPPNTFPILPCFTIRISLPRLVSLRFFITLHCSSTRSLCLPGLCVS